MEVELENIGWTDEARAASLAVRRAKAARRREGEAVSDDGERDDGGWRPSKEEIREKLKRGEALSDEERDYLDRLMEEGYAGDSDSDPIYEWMERRSEEPDYSEERGGKDSWEGIEDTAKRLIEKERRGEKMTPDEEAWLKRFREFHKERDEGIVFDHREVRNRRGFRRAGLGFVTPAEAVAEAKRERRSRRFG